MGTSGAAEAGGVLWGCPHPAEQGARERVQAFWPRAKTLAEGGLIPPEQYKKPGPPEAAPLGNNPTKPAYVNTVWGYGYKWGS